MDELIRTLVEDGWLGHLIRTAVVVVLALAVSFLARRVGTRAVARIEQKNPRNARRATTWWLVMRRVVNVVVFIVAALSLFEIWGLSLTPFVAVGAAVGAGVGFGAQNVVRDIIAGFVILSEDQYSVGDRVTILGTTGTVTDVQLRVTVLRDDEGVVHYVPNGQIGVASNMSRA